MSGGKTRAFYIEILILALIILVCLTVFIKGFGGAFTLSHEAGDTSCAVLVLDNAAADFEADPESYMANEATEVRYSREGEKTEDGPCVVKYCITQEQYENGQLIRADISITFDGEAEPARTVSTAKYMRE